MPFDKARNNTPIKNVRQLNNHRYFVYVTVKPRLASISHQGRDDRASGEITS